MDEETKMYEELRKWEMEVDQKLEQIQLEEISYQQSKYINSTSSIMSASTITTSDSDVSKLSHNAAGHNHSDDTIMTRARSETTSKQRFNDRMIELKKKTREALHATDVDVHLAQFNAVERETFIGGNTSSPMIGIRGNNSPTAGKSNLSKNNDYLQQPAQARLTNYNNNSNNNNIVTRNSFAVGSESNMGSSKRLYAGSNPMTGNDNKPKLAPKMTSNNINNNNNGRPSIVHTNSHDNKKRQQIERSASQNSTNNNDNQNEKHLSGSSNTSSTISNFVRMKFFNTRQSKSSVTSSITDQENSSRDKHDSSERPSLFQQVSLGKLNLFGGKESDSNADEEFSRPSFANITRPILATSSSISHLFSTNKK